MNKIIVIIGPTGVGKTKLSIELAKKLNGEIINGDAIQVYKHLDIGSAKVTESEKENIPHHLFDIKEVNEEYSIYDYQIDCRNKIKEIQAKNKTVIIVGGTGLYIKSALYNYTLEKTPPIKNDYEELELKSLYNIYQSKYRFTEEEELLFFALLSKPWKLEFTKNHYNNTLQVQKLLDYIVKGSTIASKEDQEDQET